jgi:acyl dehydratase
MCAAVAVSPSLVGLELGPVAYAWSPRDAILYSLGIGARYPTDLEFLYEGARPEGLRVESTFALVAVTRMLPLLVEALGIDLRRLLHAGQELEVLRVPPATGRCQIRRRVTGVWDKGIAAIIDCEDVVEDEHGLLARASSNWWVAGAGNFGGGRAIGRRASVPIPGRPPDVRVMRTTSAEQSALYRLSGDLNPVHIDPAFAREAGQPRPFLHGLCTFGLLGHMLERHAAPGLRLASMSGRFTKPVFPGDRLGIELWHVGPGEALATVAVGDSRALGPVTATLIRCS